MDVERALRERAEAQHGVVARFQTRTAGTRHAVDHELGSGRWEEVLPGVFRLVGSSRSTGQAVMAGLLRCGPGAVVSHHSSLALWAVDGFEWLPLHVLRMRGTNGVKVRSERIHVHETRRLPPHHITVSDAFICTTPSRAVADLAGGVAPGRLERIVDGLWARRLVTFDSLRRIVDDLTSRGRPGIRVLRDIVDRRGRDFVAPASSLESRLNQILREAGLPGVRRQVDVGGEQWVGRTDFRIDGTAVLIEAQSERFHTALSAISDDARRRAAMEAAGFVVVEVWERDVWHRPGRVVSAVRAALDRSASVSAGWGRV